MKKFGMRFLSMALALLIISSAVPVQALAQSNAEPLSQDEAFATGGQPPEGNNQGGAALSEDELLLQQERLAQQAQKSASFTIEEYLATEVLDETSGRKARNAIPSQVNNIVIFGRFQDTADGFHYGNGWRERAEQVFNGTSGNSLKSYLSTLSYGKLTVDSTLFPVAGSASLTVEIPYKQSYFRDYTDRNKVEAELVTALVNGAAAQLAQAGVVYDGSSLTFVLPTYSGNLGDGAPITSGTILWPHKTEFSGVNAPLINGKPVNTYTILSTGSANNGLMGASNATASTLIHEFLHTRALPDLYDTDNTVEPVGNWDIMSSSDSVPSPMTAIYQREALGYGNELDSITASQRVTLNFPKYINGDEKYAVKIKNPTNDKEYFVAEARSQKVNGVQQDGILLYRINEATGDIWSGNYNKPNDYIYVMRKGETAVNAGNGNIDTAIIPTGGSFGTVGSTVVGSSLYYNNGINSNIQIKNVAVSGDTVTFDVAIPAMTIKGTGTQADPYLLAAPDHLDYLGRYPLAQFKLENDIDMNGTAFTTVASIFKGVLDGNGKTIKNLNILSNDDAALFSSIGGAVKTAGEVAATVKNLTFENAVIKTTSQGLTAAVVASSAQNALIQNVKVIGGSVTANNRAGGIVAAANATTIEGCVVTARVEANEAGGVAAVTTKDTTTVGKAKLQTKLNNNIIAGEIAGKNSAGALYAVHYDEAPIANGNYFNKTTTKLASPQNGGVIGFAQADKVQNVKVGETGSAKLTFDIAPLTVAYSSSAANLVIDKSTGSYTVNAAGDATIMAELTVGNSKYVALQKVSATAGNAAQGKTGWNLIAGRWYNFDDNGAQLLGWQYKEENGKTKQFYYDALGQLMNQGWGTLNNLRRYVDSDGAMHQGWIEDNGKRYYTTPNGAIVKGSYSIGGANYYFDNNGVLQQLTNWQKLDGKWYLFDSANKLVVGFQQKTDGLEQGYYYYLNDGSLLAEGWHMINGSKRYVEGIGRLASGWKTDDEGKHRYMNLSGWKAMGWNLIAGRWYNFDDNGSQLLGWQYKEENGRVKQFYYDAMGQLMNQGWGTLNNLRRYVDSDGAMHQGWVEDNGKRYYTTPNGAIVKGSYSIGGANYYFDNNGVLQQLTNWQKLDGKWYLFDSANKLAVGFQQKTDGLEQGYYYYLNDGSLLAEGWHMINGSKRYVEGIGRLASGWKTDDEGKHRYMNLSGWKAMGWNLIAGRWYNFDDNGAQLLGWQYKEENGKTKQFYYDASGALLSAGWNDFNGLRRYVDSDGAMHQGWVEDNGKRYYTTPNGAIVKGQFTAIDGVYWFDNNGVQRLLNGWQLLDNKWYNFDNNGKQQLGWQYKEVNDKVIQFYYNTDGKLMNAGWGILNNLKRFVNADGSFYSGWLENGGKKYFTKANGAVVVGWEAISGRWYNFNSEGEQQLGWQYKEENGRVKQFYYDAMGQLMNQGWGMLNNLRRYVDSDGAMHQGWLFDGGKYYHTNPNGTVMTGWNTINGRWYSFDNNGVQLLGWQYRQVGNTAYQYYYQSNGQLFQSGWVLLNNLKRFVDADGAMHQGWLNLDNEAYFTTNNGAVVTGLYYISGVSHAFLPDGRFIAPPRIASVSAEYYAGTQNYTITVSAGFGIVGKHPQAYSFDGGKTWQESSQFYIRATQNGKIPVNTIMVRDSLTINGVPIYQTSVYAQEVSVNLPTVGSKVIDVSAFQGNIDWAAAAADGVGYAIIRSIYWQKGAPYYDMDPYFYQNVINAKANGIKVGAYIYSYAFSPTEAIEEAMLFVNHPQVKALKAAGIKFDMPIYFDYEDRLVVDKKYTADYYAAILRAGMVTLDQNGYYPGFYTYYAFAKSIGTQQLMNEGYPFWVAHYSASQNPWAGAGMWQYSSTSAVKGISGRVDMNYLYVNYPALINPGGGAKPNPIASTLRVTDVNTNTIVERPYAEIISMIVQNEVGNGVGLSGGDRVKLFQAQAIAAHSWVTAHHAAGIAAPSVGLKAASDQVKQAVETVKNLRLFTKVDGKDVVANAAYGSASAPVTNTAANMNWAAQPYLTNVNSPQESAYTNYQRQTRNVSKGTMEKNIDKLLKRTNATAGWHESQWLTSPTYDQYGYLTSILVCGTRVNGGTFYENCWGLISPNFTMQYNASANVWTFTTNGNGHCVGMSQYGAAGLIGVNAYSYQQVLANYFPGTFIA